MEESSHEDNKRMSAVFVDDLLGLTSQLPTSFDFGTTLVDLTCIDVSSIRIVLGSSCGAIFIYDRATNKLRKPLRTTKEYVTVCRQNGTMIATGNHSGCLMILKVPELHNEQIDQRVERDQHRGSSIRCLEWSIDGSKVFSADESGVVILTHVHFEQKVFTHSFIYCGPSPVRDISYRLSVISLNSLEGSTVVVHIETTDVEVVGEQIEGPTPTLLSFWIGNDDRFLCSLREDFLLLGYSSENLITPLKILNVREAIKQNENTLLFVNGNEKVMGRMEDSSKILISRYESDGMFSLLTDKGETALVRLKEDWSIDVILKLPIAGLPSRVFDLTSNHGLLFILMNKRRVACVANERVAELWRQTVSAPSALTTFSSLMNSTSSFFERVMVPKEETITRIGTVIGEGASLGKSSIDQLNNKIVPTIDGILNNVRNHVDTSTSESREGVPIFFHEPKGDNTELAIDVCEDMIQASVMSVVRKERTQRKKKNEDDIMPCDNGLVSVSIPSCSKVSEETLREIRNVIANISSRSVTSSPLWLRKNEVPTILEDGCSSASEEESVDLENTRDREKLSCSRSRQNSACISPEKSSAQREELPSVATVEQLNSSEAIALLLRKQKMMSLESGLELASPSEISPSITNLRHKRVEKAVFVNDQVDIWNRISLPYTPSWLSVTSHSIILSHRKRNPKFAELEELGQKKVNWHAANWPATQVDCNEEGSLVWRIHKNVAYSTSDLETRSKWTVVARDGSGVVQCAVTEKDVWYITKKGVSLQMELPEQGIFHETECDWPLKCLTASSHAAWAIRSDNGSLAVRVGLNRCRMGYDWIEISPEGVGRLAAISLCATTGFCIDENGRVWMAKGVDEHHPYGISHQFLRVCTPLHNKNLNTLPNPSEWRIRASPRGLFISVGRTLFMSRGVISGHGFTRIVPEKMAIYDNFSLIAAGGLKDENIDGLFSCRPNSEVFCYRPSKKSFLTYMLPLADGQLSTVISICALPGNLFMLDSCGSVFERRIDGENILSAEAQWSKIDTKGEFLVSFCAAETLLWAISSYGRILARIQIDSEYKWITVDPPSNLGNTTLEEIRCSRDGHYVWILSVTGKKCWARSDVSKNRLMGVQWIEACSDPAMIELCIGCNVVWGRSAEGVIYRLRGLASGNPAGNYWRPLPVKLRRISLDAMNALWGIDENSQLVRHVMEVHGCNQSLINHQSDSFEFV